jgi:peptidoglycan/xylan/chitin deacetylase (PgdA/CDA1 family)
MKLALTFDAEHPDQPGSDDDVVDQILDVLKGTSVRATFFVQGRWASAYPERARAIAKAGHLIGSHSHYHADMRLLSETGIVADLERARDTIRSTTRVDPHPWFRFPFSFGINERAAARAVVDAGYKHFFWDIDSLDWRGASSRQIFKRVSKVAERGDETIALFHTWPQATPEGVGRIIEWARARSVEFVTVDQLAHDHSGFGPSVIVPPPIRPLIIARESA